MSGKDLRDVLEELDFWFIPTSFFRYGDFRKGFELKVGKIPAYLSLGIVEAIRFGVYFDAAKSWADYFGGKI